MNRGDVLEDEHTPPIYMSIWILWWYTRKKCHLKNLLIFGDIFKEANLWAFETDKQNKKNSKKNFLPSFFIHDFAIF